MARFIGVGLAFSLVAASSIAGAQEFAKGGQVVVAAERLTGVFSDHSTRKEPGVEDKDHYTRVALLGMPTASQGESPAATPRVAADVFVYKGLSLGGAIMYLNGSGSSTHSDPPNPTAHDDLPTTNAFIFSPRIGYGLQLGQNFAIWPRAGVTYANYRTSQRVVVDQGPPVLTAERKNSIDFTDLTIEFVMAILPVDHFAVLVGPYIDIPLGGGEKNTVNGTIDPVRPEWTYLSFGLWAGLGGFFGG